MGSSPTPATFYFGIIERKVVSMKVAKWIFGLVTAFFVGATFFPQEVAAKVLFSSYSYEPYQDDRAIIKVTFFADNKDIYHCRWEYQNGNKDGFLVLSSSYVDEHEVKCSYQMRYDEYGKGETWGIKVKPLGKELNEISVEGQQASFEVTLGESKEKTYLDTSTALCEDNQKSIVAPVLKTIRTENDITVVLHWELQTDDQPEYEVAYGTKSGQYDKKLTTKNQNEQRVDNLDPNTKYFFVVRAKTDCATSDYSNELAILPLTGEVTAGGGAKTTQETEAALEETSLPTPSPIASPTSSPTLSPEVIASQSSSFSEKKPTIANPEYDPNAKASLTKNRNLYWVLAVVGIFLLTVIGGIGFWKKEQIIIIARRFYSKMQAKRRSDATRD